MSPAGSPGYPTPLRFGIKADARDAFQPDGIPLSHSFLSFALSYVPLTPKDGHGDTVILCVDENPLTILKSDNSESKTYDQKVNR
jgi:hypothetical protein